MIAFIVLSLVATAIAAPQYPAGVHPSICPNYPFAANAYQRVAQINQAVAPAALPQVPGLAQPQQAEAPATTLHIANEDRVKQAEQLLIQLQAEQGVYYL